MKLMSVFTLLTCSLLVLGCQSEQEPARGVHSQARHAAFKAMMPNYTNMVQMANGGKGYQQAEFQQLVARFEAQAQQPFTHFQQDGKGQDGKAKPEVWSKPAEFEHIQQQFFKSIQDLKVAAAQGNQEEINTAIKQVDTQCMACHSQFRD